ncbi:MAG: glycosyltransferase family protein [Magnetococcales bacterium]|nr:glycosyltransferase family protein [Magnetococcales bacterium]
MKKTNSVLAILQARTSSSRLPGKVLRPLLGQPMLQRQIERIQRASLLDGLLVATSLKPEDDGVAKLCQETGLPCFRGSLEDVLDRYYQAACRHEPTHVVRLTGDCPLADPEVIDQVIRCHLKGGYDYTSNTFPATWPDGLDVEVIRFSALESAWQEARLPSEREHVTPFVRHAPDRFAIGHVRHTEDLSHWRWSVDYGEDFELISRIYEALHPQQPDFGTGKILELLAKDPQLAKINHHYTANDGWFKSLNEDEAFLAAKKPHQVS